MDITLQPVFDTCRQRGGHNVTARTVFDLCGHHVTDIPFDLWPTFVDNVTDLPDFDLWMTL